MWSAASFQPALERAAASNRYLACRLLHVNSFSFHEIHVNSLTLEYVIAVYNIYIYIYIRFFRSELDTYSSSHTRLKLYTAKVLEST